MRPIISNLATLAQYLKAFEQKKICLEFCPHCGKANPRRHGNYGRKADREHYLNPIPILPILPSYVVGPTRMYTTQAVVFMADTTTSYIGLPGQKYTTTN